MKSSTLNYLYSARQTIIDAYINDETEKTRKDLDELINNITKVIQSK